MNKLGAAAGVALVVAVAALLALPLLREGFWCDEALSIAIAHDAFPGPFFHDVRVAESTPPLFNLLLAGWGRAFGWQEPAVKAYALCWGLLSIAGIAAAGWQLGGPIAGLLAGALALHSPLITSHVAETRSYAMSAALLTFGIAAAWCGVERNRRGLQAAAAIFFALASWTHYVAFVAIAGCCGLSIVMAFAKRDAAWRRIAVINAIGAAAIVLLVPMIASQVHNGLPYESQRSAANRLMLAAQKFSFALPRSNFAPPWLAALAAVAATIAALVFVRAIPDSLRRHARPLTFVAFYAVPVFAVFGPFGSVERYVVIGAAALCLFFSVLIVAIARAGANTIVFRAAVVAYFVLSIGAVILQAPQIIATPAWSKSGARPFAAQLRGTDIVLAAPEILAETISYYAPQPYVAGFTIWDRPQVPDVSQQRVLWSHAISVVPQTVQRLDGAIRARRPSRVFIVSGRIGAGDPLWLDPRIRALLTALNARWSLRQPVSFPGRVETLVVWQLTPRR